VAAERRPTIWVIAGPNGGGKTTIVGEMIRESGADYFDPDEVTRRLCERNPGLSLTDANAIAWQESRRRLEASISNRENFTFETTLGGRTIARLLHRAADGGLAVKVWYVALDSADRHVARVKARVARGGHDVAEGRIRERYDRSRATLSRLVPKLAALKVYDNSFEARVERLERPRLRLILDLADGRIRNRERLADTPEWAKPIVAAALKAERSAGE
jgi:predicted ABC-type ATPase